MTNEVFAGTAAYYARYRVDYPEAVYDVIRDRFGLGDPRGALLDLGTGTGFLALRLAPHFERVTALDVSAEMLQQARAAAAAKGASHMSWHQRPAEELGTLDATPDGGPYRLTTIGSAFHWMDQPRVLDLTYDRTTPGGGIFITALPGFISPDNTEVRDRLAATILEVVQQYVGTRRRAGSGFYTPPAKRWEEYLAESRYQGVECGVERFTVEFDLEGVVGLLYSTSFANPSILGERIEAFDRDLRAALLTFDASGRYLREYEAEWVLARRPS